MARKLLLLNGLAIIAVAVSHAASWGFDAMFSWTNRYRVVSVPNYDQLGSLSYYISLIIKQIASFDIPAFLFVSGFFVAFAARGSQFQLKWDFVFTRIRNLLLPFAIWLVVRLALLLRIPSSLDDIFLPLYYIPLIIQFYLLSPIIVPLAKYRWKLLLLVSSLLYTGLQSLRYLRVIGVDFPGLEQLIDLTPSWFFPILLFWFALGIVVGFHGDQFKGWLQRGKWVLLLITATFAGLTIVEYQAVANLAGKPWLGASFPPIFSRFLYQLSFLLIFVAFENISIPFAKQITQIGSKSLGIYLMNQSMNYVVARFMYFVFPWILGYQFLYQPILIISGLGIPLLLMSVIVKSPWKLFYRYAFG